MSHYPGPYDAYQQPQELQYDSRVDSTTVAAFFNAVYSWMAAGLALTAVVAWWVSTQPQVMRQIFQGPTLIILFIAEIGLVIAISSAIQRISATTATALFLLYSALNGLTLSVILLVYAHASIA